MGFVLRYLNFSNSYIPVGLYNVPMFVCYRFR